MEQILVNASGKEFELDRWEAMSALMDDDLREELHRELAPCSEQEFLTAYEKAHEEKFGEEWELSRPNPQW